DPRTLRARGVMTDVTETKRYVQIVHSVTMNASSALFMMDPALRCTFMNPAAEKMTGYTFAEVQGRTLHDIIHHTRSDGRSYPISECPMVATRGNEGEE